MNGTMDKTDIAAADEAVKTARARLPWDAQWIHKKSGRLYTVMDVALDEASLRPVVIYECCRSERRWVRDAAEFLDGRFERVS
jgi:hypothetical protein